MSASKKRERQQRVDLSHPEHTSKRDNAGGMSITLDFAQRVHRMQRMGASPARIAERLDTTIEHVMEAHRMLLLRSTTLWSRSSIATTQSARPKSSGSR
jgi:hypothetical protein